MDDRQDETHRAPFAGSAPHGSTFVWCFADVLPRLGVAREQGIPRRRFLCQGRAGLFNQPGLLGATM